MTDYTDADVGLAAEAMYPRLAPPFLRHFIAAHRVLSALARAGRLLPPGGETYMSWAVRDERGAIRRWTETEARRVAAEHGGTLLCGTHTTWPDGTMLIGAWQPAEENTDG
ncbi:MAG TPA: hypothetical protein VFY84_04825 [Jiangellales bacterium]|nr:hypothetical protein [Jiangellales bacterium]